MDGERGVGLSRSICNFWNTFEKAKEKTPRDTFWSDYANLPFPTTSPENKEVLWILFQSEGGICVFHHVFHGRYKLDQDAESGLLSAINMYAKDLDKEDVKSIEMGDYCLLRFSSGIVIGNSAINLWVGFHNHREAEANTKNGMKGFAGSINAEFDQYVKDNSIGAISNTDLFIPFKEYSSEVFLIHRNQLQKGYHQRILNKLNEIKLTPELENKVEKLEHLVDESEFVNEICKLMHNTPTKEKWGMLDYFIKKDTRFVEEVGDLLKACPPLLNDLKNVLNGSEVGDYSIPQLEEIFKVKRIDTDSIKKIQNSLDDLKSALGQSYSGLNEWAKGIQEHYSKKLVEKVKELGIPEYSQPAELYLKDVVKDNSEERYTANKLFEKLLSSHEVRSHLESTIEELYNKYKDLGRLLGVKIFDPDEIHDNEALGGYDSENHIIKINFNNKTLNQYRKVIGHRSDIDNTMAGIVGHFNDKPKLHQLINIKKNDQEIEGYMLSTDNVSLILKPYGGYCRVEAVVPTNRVDKREIVATVEGGFTLQFMYNEIPRSYTKLTK